MKYLVCYDGSDESSNVLDYVSNFARKGSEIVLWAAYDKVDEGKAEPADVPKVIYRPQPSVDWVAEEKKRRETVAKYRLTVAKDKLVKEGVDEAAITEVTAECEDVRDAALEYAEGNKIDCIVVGSRGHGALKRAFLGSLSTYLAHNASCHVVIARGTN